MRKLISILVGAVGVVAGIYLAVVLLFIGGIQEIVHAASTHPLPAGQLGWGIARVVFCEMGWLAIYAGGALALAIWPENVRSVRRGIPKRRIAR